MMPDESAEPDRREIATIVGGRDITRGFVPDGLLTPQDEVIRRRGYDYRLYEMVLGDDQVMSCLQQRRAAVVSRPWDVVAGGPEDIDQRAADSLKEQLRSLPWDTITSKMLFGTFYGYSIAECLWDVSGSEVVLSQVKVRNRRRFRFGEDGQPKLITYERPLGETLPERKFWTFSTGADNSDEPYGLGLAHWLYWPVFFKRNDIRFWLIFLEKFGQPTPMAQYPKGASPEEQERALAAAAAVAKEAAIALPEGFEITLIEAARSGAADYQAMYEAMNAAIAKVILSQTMTTEDGSSLAQGQVHDGVKKEVIRADYGLIAGSFQEGPARWLTEWNYPSAAVPRVTRQLDEAIDLATLADRDTKINQLGYEPTEEYILTTYGPGWTKNR